MNNISIHIHCNTLIQRNIEKKKIAIIKVQRIFEILLLLSFIIITVLFIVISRINKNHATRSSITITYNCIHIYFNTIIQSNIEKKRIVILKGLRIFEILFTLSFFIIIILFIVFSLLLLLFFCSCCHYYYYR